MYRKLEILMKILIMKQPLFKGSAASPWAVWSLKSNSYHYRSPAPWRSHRNSPDRDCSWQVQNLQTSSNAVLWYGCPGKLHATSLQCYIQKRHGLTVLFITRNLYGRILFRIWFFHVCRFWRTSTNKRLAHTGPLWNSAHVWSSWKCARRSVW